MADDLGLAVLDRPVGGARPGGADAELSVHAPRLRVAGVVGMVEHRDVDEVVAALDLHPDVDPHRALAFGAFVALPRGVDDLGRHAFAPGHAQEETAVVVLADRHVGSGLSTPFEVEQESALVFAHRPALGLGQDRVLRLVQQVVDRLPANLVSALPGDGDRHSPPVVSLRVVKEVPAVDAREAPVEPGLMLMVFGAEFGDHALPVGCGDRMQVGPRVRPGVLRQDRVAAAGSIDRQGSGPLVLPDDQALLSRARRLLLAFNHPTRDRSDRGEDAELASESERPWMSNRVIASSRGAKDVTQMSLRGHRDLRAHRDWPVVPYLHVILRRESLTLRCSQTLSNSGAGAPRTVAMTT